MSYLHQVSTRRTPQRERIPGRTDQVQNSEGGFVWAVDKWTRLERFLILGAEGGTYYIGEADLTKQNVGVLDDCLTDDPARTVSTIVAVSAAGRNAKQEPVVFALAYAAGFRTEAARQAALRALPDVVRTGSHMGLFLSYVQNFRGWGRSLRRAVGQWYVSRDRITVDEETGEAVVAERAVDRVAFQMVKYRSRYGFSQRDALRKAHPANRVSSRNPTVEGLTEDHERLYNWVVNGGADERLPQVVHAFEAAQASESPAQTAKLIERYGNLLTREMLHTEHLTDRDVNRALVEAGMPMGALVRNLANLTRYGVFEDRAYVKQVVAQLTNPDAVRRSRLHPYAVLTALCTYAAGYSMTNPEQRWNPVAQIVDALDAAFYLSFGNAEPTGKRIRLALDVSGSMGHPIITGYRKGRYGMEAVPSAVSCAAGAGAMALVTANIEDDYDIVAFSDGQTGGRYIGGSWGYNGDASGAVLAPCTISPRQRLDDVVGQMNRLNFGRTDCALPILDAAQRGLEFDAFVVYTDNETWFGKVHPTQALAEYRQKTGIPAKLVVVSMEANQFSIAHPDDPGMLDVVGFDPAAPAVIADFLR
jgi:60 kDa SS-A/Ro ribonucleoprotein